MKVSPIVLFVYNRPHHTKKVIEALAAIELATSSEIFIFSDGPKQNPIDVEAVKQVRLYIHAISFFQKIQITERTENIGLSENIISGINSIFEQYDQAIILEDDTLPSPEFLKYMNEALEIYRNEITVGTVQGFQFPVNFDKNISSYFDYSVGCWGWGTWKNRWVLFEPNGAKLLNQIEEKELTNKFNLNNNYPFIELLKNQIEGKSNSWAIRWYASLFLKEKLNYYPCNSFIKNIGNDGSGTHIDKTNYSVLSFQKKVTAEKIQVKQDQQAFEVILKYRRKLKRANQKKNFLRKIRINVLGLSK